MPLLSSIAGFSLFGLAARVGQLGIQKRNPFENLAGHAISMGVFGYIGYWAHQWNVYSTQLIEQKQSEIAERQRIRVEKSEAIAARLMQEVDS